MANPSEIYLTTSNVNGAHFGKLFARNVDGAIFAQPLYLHGVTITQPGHGHTGSKQVTLNLVYVVTSHNNVYAFDADNPNSPAPIWSVNLGPFATVTEWSTGMGILSTPLIVRGAGAMYVVAATFENGARIFRLHALDLATGAEKFAGPATISGSVPGTAADSQNGIVTFNANAQIQRTGLALAGNNVIFGFAADRDIGTYHGWVFSYDLTSLQPTGVFNDARNIPAGDAQGAGIWQSGRAPAVDASNAIYLETGNGTFDGTADFGESFLKFTNASNGLTLADWFTPSSWDALNNVDYDLSSTGPSLIPGTTLVFGGSKSGTIYLLATDSLGHETPNDSGILQSFTATSGCQMPFVFQGCAQIMGHVFWAAPATPVLYVWGVNDIARAYQFAGGTFNTTPITQSAAPANYPGGVMSLSSYLATAGTGILWAITCDTPNNGDFFGPGFVGSATLHAYDATDLTKELWNSSQNPSRDALGTFASFAPPVAVNGKVYVPTFSNQLVVYGLLRGPVTGDVNGDSVVNCTDVAIVQASFGKSAGQPGFDLRADVNGDGTVNMLDLSIVSQQLPRKTTCP